MSILQGYEEEEDQRSEQAPQVSESQPAKFSVKWDRNNPEHWALHRIFGEECLSKALVKEMQDDSESGCVKWSQGRRWAPEMRTGILFNTPLPSAHWFTWVQICNSRRPSCNLKELMSIIVMT
ncbi:hypothetical protein EC968_008496 [Mortierella alpina]|nr:hypothetical protein EC968_008496 [Mortierella alpina]